MTFFGPTEDEILDAVRVGTVRSVVLDVFDATVGYTVTIPGLNCVDGRTRAFRYETDCEFLHFVQNGHVPHVLTDLFEKYCPEKLFYQGCIVVHIRRHWTYEKGDTYCDDDLVARSQWKVLRPTALSLMHDLNGILAQALAENRPFQELQNIESSFWKTVFTSCRLVNGEECNESPNTLPLFPPHVQYIGVSNYEQLNNNNNNNTIDQLRLSRKRKHQTDVVLSKTLKTFGFVGKNHTRTKFDGIEAKLRQFIGVRDLSPTWKPMLPSTKNPMEILEKKHLLPAVPNNNYVADDFRRRNDYSILVEEYDLEFKANSSANSSHNTSFTSLFDQQVQQRIQSSTVSLNSDSLPATNAGGSTVNYKFPRTKIVIDKRSTDWTFRGRLILDRGQNAETGQPKIVECNFPLGSEWLSKAYIVQYLDMVSEGGRKPAHLTRTQPGKTPQVLNIKGFGNCANNNNSTTVCRK